MACSSWHKHCIKASYIVYELTFVKVRAMKTQGLKLELEDLKN